MSEWYPHEAVLPLTLLQGVLDEGSQLQEEELLRGPCRGAGALGLTVLLTQLLCPLVGWNQ